MPSFSGGDEVQVRTWAEIRATLDELDTLDAYRFTSAMRGRCGHRYRVAEVVKHRFDEVTGQLVRCRDVYTLEGVICDGSGNPAAAGCGSG